MRNRTPAISWAMASNAPPSTRSVIGSTLTRLRLGGPGETPTSGRSAMGFLSVSAFRGLLNGLGVGDDEVAHGVDLAREARRDDGRGVELGDDRGSLDDVSGDQLGALVERGLDLLELAVDAEPGVGLELEGARGRSALALLDLRRIESGHQPDRAHAHVRDLDVGVLEAARVLALVDVVERRLHGVDPGRVDRSRADVDPELVALPLVARLRDVLVADVLDAVVLELRPGLGLELLELLGERLPGRGVDIQRRGHRIRGR